MHLNKYGNADSKADNCFHLFRPVWYKISQHEEEPHLLTQEDKNDLVRDLSLSKEKAKVLG